MSKTGFHVNRCAVALKEVESLHGRTHFHQFENTSRMRFTDLSKLRFRLDTHVHRFRHMNLPMNFAARLKVRSVKRWPYAHSTWHTNLARCLTAQSPSVMASWHFMTKQLACLIPSLKWNLETWIQIPEKETKEIHHTHIYIYIYATPPWRVYRFHVVVELKDNLVTHAYLFECSRWFQSQIFWRIWGMRHKTLMKKSSGIVVYSEMVAREQ